MRIYLDHSATTAVDKKVFAEMKPFFSEKFGNPSSIHSFGQEALEAVDKARRRAAEFLNCEPEEVVFTSGATEADNLAVLGLAEGLRYRREKIHIITSQIEHPAVFAPFQELEKRGVETSYLPVNKSGLVSVEDLKKAIRENTVFVSIMFVNSETGSVQPIREIGKAIAKENEAREKQWNNSGRKGILKKIYFHTDAVQAANFFDCDTKKLKVDLLSLSGHKIYGPKGIGALFVRKGTPLRPIVFGGHHELGLRSGTLNVSAIVGLGAALALASKGRGGNNLKISKMRDMLADGILKEISGATLNTDRENGSPAHAHFSFAGVEGESVLVNLDLEGIAVSTGSACASGGLKASHVLLAMGIDAETAHGSVRFTLGKDNSPAEIKKVLSLLPGIVERLKKMAPKKEKAKKKK